MFRITEDPSSGSLVQYLAKITRLALSCPLTWTWSVLWHLLITRCVCSSLSREAQIIKYLKVLQHVSYTVNYTHAQRVTICCHNTDYVHVNGHDRTITVIFSQALYKAP